MEGCVPAPLRSSNVLTGSNEKLVFITTSENVSVLDMVTFGFCQDSLKSFRVDL